MACCYPEGNKRLAMVGDAVLELALLGDLRLKNLTRGEDKSAHAARFSSIPMLRTHIESMNNTMIRIVSNKNLVRVGRQIHLENLVNTNLSQGGVVSPKTISATFEAILGAVYLDCGKKTEPVGLVMANLGLWPEQGQEQEQ
jgi:ribonuclease-3